MKTVKAFLDTHVILWILNGEISRLSEKVRQAIEVDEFLVSPMVSLEITYLHEVGKIKIDSKSALSEISSKIRCSLAEGDLFEDIMQQALKITWTRDVFDRLIVAHAQLRQLPLVTKDSMIRKNYSHCIW